MSAASQTPSFQWLPVTPEQDADAILKIDFHDGKPADIALLKKDNPIPRLENEREEDIDQCIFSGKLLHEPNVAVTLTGGCPFEDSFEIVFNSKRLQASMFKMTKGIVKEVRLDFGDYVDDIAVEPPQPRQWQRPNPPVNPNGFMLSITINYDEGFSQQFGSEATKVIERVAALAKDVFLWPSLAQPMHLQVQIGQKIPLYVSVTQSQLSVVGPYNAEEANVNVYMCSPRSRTRTAGIAWVGTVCRPKSMRTGIVQYMGNDMSTALIFAHEVGHIIGMKHDFNDNRSPRFDSKGNRCTGVNTVMDYTNSRRKWSHCSNEDFQLRYHGCLEPNTGTNSGPNTGTNTGPNTGTNTGPNTGTNTGPNTGTNTGPNTGTNTGPNTGTNWGSNTGTNVGPSTWTNWGPGTGTRPNYGTNTGPNTGTNWGTNTGTNTWPNTGTNWGSNTGTNWGPSTGTRPNYGTNTGPNTGTNWGPNTGTNFGPNTGTNFGPNTGTNFGPNTGTNFGPNTGTNFGRNTGTRQFTDGNVYSPQRRRKHYG